jgi:hypothetical protein
MSFALASEKIANLTAKSAENAKNAKENLPFASFAVGKRS